jgi:hypothetical protein
MHEAKMFEPAIDEAEAEQDPDDLAEQNVSEDEDTRADGGLDDLYEDKDEDEDGKISSVKVQHLPHF